MLSMMEHLKNSSHRKHYLIVYTRSKTDESHLFSPLIFGYYLKNSTRPVRCLDVASILIFATADIFYETEVLVILVFFSHTFIDLAKLFSWNMGVLMLVYVWRWQGKDEESDNPGLCLIIFVHQQHCLIVPWHLCKKILVDVFGFYVLDMYQLSN